jgi:hypothetical protein
MRQVWWMMVGCSIAMASVAQGQTLKAPKASQWRYVWVSSRPMSHVASPFLKTLEKQAVAAHATSIDQRIYKEMAQACRAAIQLHQMIAQGEEALPSTKQAFQELRFHMIRVQSWMGQLSKSSPAVSSKWNALKFHYQKVSSFYLGRFFYAQRPLIVQMGLEQSGRVESLALQKASGPIAN